MVDALVSGAWGNDFTCHLSTDPSRSAVRCSNTAFSFRKSMMAASFSVSSNWRYAVKRAIAISVMVSAILAAIVAFFSLVLFLRSFSKKE